jgi:hypothetical protein
MFELICKNCFPSHFFSQEKKTPALNKNWNNLPGGLGGLRKGHIPKEAGNPGCSPYTRRHKKTSQERE